MKLILKERFYLSVITLSLGAVACQSTSADTVDQAALAASLEVNEDGGDTSAIDTVDGAPFLLNGCGFDLVREHIEKKYDGDHDGTLSADESANAEEDFGGEIAPRPLADGPNAGDRPAGAPPADGPFAGEPPAGGPPAAGIGGAPGDGGGALPPRARMRHHRMELLARIYDSNRDHKLSDDEKEVLKSDLAVRCENRLKALVAEFDEDGDGQLSDAEWTTAHAAIKARFDARKAEFLAKFDTNGDGNLSESEHEAAREAFRQELETRRAADLKAFDADGDGVLSADEREALVAELRKRVRGESTDESGATEASPVI